MARTPFKLRSGNSPLALDPFGLKAKKELKARKKIDETSKKIKETSKKAKELHAKYTAEDAAEKEATKKHRPSGTSDSYMKKHGIGPYAPKTETPKLKTKQLDPEPTKPGGTEGGGNVRKIVSRIKDYGKKGEKRGDKMRQRKTFGKIKKS